MTNGTELVVIFPNESEDEDQKKINYFDLNTGNLRLTSTTDNK